VAFKDSGIQACDGLWRACDPALHLTEALHWNWLSEVSSEVVTDLGLELKSSKIFFMVVVAKKGSP
jgi:hypothetical protein